MRLTDHHRKPKCQRGNFSNPGNRYRVDDERHVAWHRFAPGYHNPKRIACILSVMTLDRWIELAFRGRRDIYFGVIPRDATPSKVKIVKREKFRRKSMGDAWLQEQVNHKFAEGFELLFKEKSFKEILREINECWLDGEWQLIAYIETKRLVGGLAVMQVVY